MDRTHHFFGQAEVLSGHLNIPLMQDIKQQAFVKLPAEGGYRSEQAQNYRLEGVISFETAYTQVSGSQSRKTGHGWNTLVTSAITGLNVLDVVTADRVVAQISTEHPLEGYTPIVTFLGTRFENLKIGGHPVNPVLDLAICGPKPNNDQQYIQDPGFLGRVGQQYAQINSAKGVPDLIAKKYNASLLNPAKIKTQAAAAQSNPNQTPKPTIECSLVNSVAQGLPGTSFGHVIDVPNFGTVYLANLIVDDDSFNLTMIKLDLGCVADGNADMGNGIVNGKTVP